MTHAVGSGSLPWTGVESYSQEAYFLYAMIETSSFIG